MHYGMYISATGAMTSMYRQDVFTNNLANTGTPGFKPVTPFTRQRDDVRSEDGLWHMASNAMLERLGGGAHLNQNHVAFKQGPIDTTGNPLDLAINGDGFFVVRAGGGAEGEELRFSRDGRLTRDRESRLVRVTDGLPVLDEMGREIHLPNEGDVVIDGDGAIRSGGRLIARLQIVDVPDRSRLTPAGETLLKPTANALTNAAPASGRVVQNAVEGSAATEISALMELTGASRAAQSNLGMISYYDRMMDRAINTFGRVA